MIPKPDPNQSCGNCDRWLPADEDDNRGVCGALPMLRNAGTSVTREGWGTKCILYTPVEEDGPEAAAAKEAA